MLTKKQIKKILKDNLDAQYKHRKQLLRARLIENLLKDQKMFDDTSN